MRVCVPHMKPAVETVMVRSTDHEVDFCPACLEFFNLLQTKEFWEIDAEEKVTGKRGRPPKAKETTT